MVLSIPGISELGRSAAKSREHARILVDFSHNEGSAITAVVFRRSGCHRPRVTVSERTTKPTGVLLRDMQRMEPIGGLR